MMWKIFEKVRILILVVLVFILGIGICMIFGSDENSSTNIEFIVQEFRK